MVFQLILVKNHNTVKPEISFLVVLLSIRLINIKYGYLPEFQKIYYSTPIKRIFKP